MTAQSLRRTQLTDEVATVLRNRIMTGDLRPGDFVRLDETASALGCSATPVREALVTLRGEGLVRSSPHRGFIVEPLDRPVRPGRLDRAMEIVDGQQPDLHGC